MKKKCCRIGASVVLFFGSSIVSTVYADIIIDPDNVGLTAVFPANGVLNGNTSPYAMYIGYSGTDGSLLVDANPSGPTILEIYGDSQVGAGLSTGSGAGTLRIVGDGSPYSAEVINYGSLAVGIGGNGLVEVRNGGHLSATSIQLGSSGSVDADILVDGPGSVLESTGGFIHFGGDAIGNTRSLTISGGAEMYTYGVYDGVFNPGGDYSPGSLMINRGDRMIVTGTDTASIAMFEMSVQNRGMLEVTGEAVLYQEEPAGVIDSFTSIPDPRGFMSMRVGAVGSTASVLVSDSAVIDLTRSVRIGGFENGAFLPDGNGGEVWTVQGSSGRLVVENGAYFYAEGDIIVSESGIAGGDGVLTIRNGGEVSAGGTVIVNEGGMIDGDGGILLANVLVDGGTLAPGNSPGTLTIYGDLEILSGTLDIEIGGTQQDLLDVYGNVTLSGDTTLNLHFINGFAPSQGDGFSFINAFSSSIDFSGLTVNLFGLQDGFQYTLSSTGGLTLFAMNDAVSAVPVPAALWLFGSGLAGLIGVARRRS